MFFLSFIFVQDLLKQRKPFNPCRIRIKKCEATKAINAVSQCILTGDEKEP